MGRLRIWVDKTRCLATQGCIQTAPGAFALGPDQRSEVVDPDAAPEEKLWEAAQICPTSAIILEDAETGQRLFPPE